jgi:NAD(P)-dependent dehydrogenase (short-subunit alcohol dehydrogenase family)
VTDGPRGVFDSEAITVLVAGGGGIGAALVSELLARPNVERVFCLQRNPANLAGDARFRSIACDAGSEESLDAAIGEVEHACERLHLVINTVGLLHNEACSPEKRLRDVNANALETLFRVNAAFLPLLAQRVAPLMKHSEPAVLASLSARVGSIGDNGMGGWYSYRASKAAHNMLLRTLAIEWRLSHRNTAVVALHPGTVATRLSEPYTPANYQRRVLQPAESADCLLRVIADCSPANTGCFLDWQGEEIPW